MKAGEKVIEILEEGTVWIKKPLIFLGQLYTRLLIGCRSRKTGRGRASTRFLLDLIDGGSDFHRKLLQSLSTLLYLKRPLLLHCHGFSCNTLWTLFVLDKLCTFGHLLYKKRCHLFFLDTLLILLWIINGYGGRDGVGKGRVEWLFIARLEKHRIVRITRIAKSILRKDVTVAFLLLFLLLLVLIG